jgi:hypothetical protein
MSVGTDGPMLGGEGDSEGSDSGWPRERCGCMSLSLRFVPSLSLPSALPNEVPNEAKSLSPPNVPP